MEWGGSGRVEYTEFQNRTKVCGWMGYVVGDFRTSSGPGGVWIGVPVRCYMECNNRTTILTVVKSWYNSRGKHQGRVGELVPRDSFDIIQGYANSRPGRLRVPEVMWMDGPSFSLCAALLKLSVLRSGMARTTVGGMEVWSIPVQRGMEKT